MAPAGLQTNPVCDTILQEFQIMLITLVINLINFTASRWRGAHKVLRIAAVLSSLKHLDIRKYFFSQRVVNAWNSLPQKIVDADSVNSFKNRLDEFDKYFINV